MNLKFHQKTFELLSLTPRLSEEQAKELDEVEQKWGIIFPPSVREWYSIKAAMNLLIEAKTCLGDSLLSPTEWEKTTCYLGELAIECQCKKELLKEGLWLFASYHQEVSGHWTIKLDGSDDPPVFMENDSVPDLLWEPYAYHFSEFIYELFWESVRQPKEIKLSAYTSILTQSELSLLEQYFYQSPFCNETYRFRRDFQGIQIKMADKCAIWDLSADSPSSLFDLAAQLWDLGYRLNCHYVTSEAAKVLAQLRLAGKTMPMPSREKYFSQCFDYDVPF